MSVRPNFARAAMLALVLAAYGWRVAGLADQSLWRDEVDAVYFALRDLPETLSMFVSAGQNGALFFLALRPWLWAAGASEFALRYPSALWSVAAIPVLWQVARRLLETAGQPAEEPEAADVDKGAGGEGRTWDRLLGAAPFLAALFMAVNPYQSWYAQEGKMYALATLLALLAAWWWLRGVERGGWRPWLAYLLTVSIAMYSHLLMVLLIPLGMAWFVIAWPQSRLRRRGYALALAGLTLPYLPLVVWQWRMLFSPHQHTGFSFTPLTQMLRTLLLDQSRGFLPPGKLSRDLTMLAAPGIQGQIFSPATDLPWLAPIFFLALAGLLLGWVELGGAEGTRLRLAGWRRHLLLVAWLVLPIAGVYLLSLRQPVYTPRYLIWIAPAAMMFLAQGVQLVWRNVGGLAGRGAATLLVLYVVGFWTYAGWQQKSQPIKYDLRSAVTHIAAERMPGELLILQIPHMEYAYRYYSGGVRGPQPLAGSDERLGRWAGGLWTNNGWSDEQAWAEVDRQMQLMTAGAPGIWVMLSEAEMWDSRRLMDRWLNEHAELVGQADYHGAQVRHYRLR